MSSSPTQSRLEIPPITGDSIRRHADHDPGEIVVSGIDFREGERPGRSVKTFHKYVKAEGILEKTEATTGWKLRESDEGPGQKED